MSKFRFTITRHATEKDLFERGELPSAESFLKRLVARGHRPGTKDGSGFIGATFAEGGRLEGKYVETVTAMVLDVDGKHKKNGQVFRTKIDPESVLAALPWRGVAHTSHSHTPEYPSFRVILPLAQEISVPEFRRLWWWLYEKTGRKGDASTKNPDRMYFLPRGTAESLAAGHHWIRELPGPLLSLSDMPADYEPPVGAIAPVKSGKRKGMHLAPPSTKYGAVDTHEHLAKLLELPIYVWAMEEAWSLSRECWRGLATNIAAVVLEDEEAWEAGSEAFHAVSEPDEDRYSYEETERTFRDALKSAREYGPMTYANLVLQGAPEETVPTDMDVKAPVAHARRLLRREKAAQPPKEKASAEESPPAKSAEASKKKAEEEEGADFTVRESDFLFDVTEGKWLRRFPNGEWSKPFSTGAMRQILITADMIKTTEQNLFLSRVRLIDRCEPLYDTTEPYVVRNGIRIFNTYRKTELEPRQGAWDDYHALFLNLVGGDLKALDFVLDWIAAPLQSLHQKGEPRMMGTAVVFFGSQGAGKGLTTNLFRLLYGESNVCVIGQEGLDGRFNGIIENRLMLVANEVMSSTNRSMETANKIKPWITDPYVPLERKNKDAEEVKNNMNCLFTSNDDRPVIIESTDRRFSVFQSEALDPAVGKRIDADQKGSQDQTAAFFHHLLNRPLKISFGDRYETDARKALISDNLPPERKFVEEIKELGWLGVSAPWQEHPRNKDRDGVSRDVVVNGNVVLSDTLAEVFSYFCKNEGRKRPRLSKKMGAALREAFPDVVDGRVSVGGVQRRAWFNLPMQPVDMPAPTPPSPKREEPVEFNTMIDDGDF